MRLAVLASPDSWYLADLRRAAGQKHQVIAVSFRDLEASLGGGRPAVASRGFDLRSADCLLVRTMPPASLEQVVFRMDALARLEAAGTPVINPARAIETAVDKYLASARLQEAGLRVPRTIVCQTVEDGLAAFDALGRDVVLKPLFGSEGRGIARLTDDAVALRVFKALVPLGAVLYVQEFIHHPGYDLRLLVVGDRVLAMRRSNPNDWRTNASRGAACEAFEPDEEMLRMARTAAAAVGAPLAGVDILPGPNGQLYAIEVNAVPGWKALGAALQTDVAAMVLEFLETVRRTFR